MEDTELLQSIQQIFESRFESIDKHFESFEKRFESIENRFELSEKRFDRMEADLSEVKDRAKNIELTLENDISQKLNALHEGHMLNTEKLEHISDTVDDIESSVVALDVMNRILSVRRCSRLTMCANGKHTA